MYAEQYVRVVSAFDELENYFQFQKWCYNNSKITLESLYGRVDNFTFFAMKDTLVDFKDILLPQFWQGGNIEHKKVNCFLRELEMRVSTSFVQQVLSVKDTFSQFDSTPRVIVPSEQSLLVTVSSVNFSAYIEHFHGKQERNLSIEKQWYGEHGSLMYQCLAGKRE